MTHPQLAMFTLTVIRVHNTSSKVSMQICVACVSDIQGEGGGRARAGLFPYGGASYKPWIVKSVTGSMCTRAANCKSQGLCNEP